MSDWDAQGQRFKTPVWVSLSQTPKKAPAAPHNTVDISWTPYTPFIPQRLYYSLPPCRSSGVTHWPHTAASLSQLTRCIRVESADEDENQEDHRSGWNQLHSVMLSHTSLSSVLRAYIHCGTSSRWPCNHPTGSTVVLRVCFRINLCSVYFHWKDVCSLHPSFIFV